MDAVIRLFAGIADENDAAIEIAHHVRKPAAGAAGDYDVHDIRGVAAITDAVRAARVLNRMNEKDAEAAGCGEVERLFRFRVDRAKGNYSPAQAATWRQFINVELVNGDEVGVVAPWDFPGQGEQTPEKTAADKKAEDVFLQLLDKFTASRSQRERQCRAHLRPGQVCRGAGGQGGQGFQGGTQGRHEPPARHRARSQRALWPRRSPV